MRPTENSRVVFDDILNQKMDIAAKDKVGVGSVEINMSGGIANLWVEFATTALEALASNKDITPNNNPVFITDEAAMMADRMVAAYLFRFEK